MTNTILVTGANRGIGLELVKQYAKTGCIVLACCRYPDSAAALQDLSHTYQSIHIYQLDISDDHQIKQLASQLKNTTIDILFNNAGIAGQDNAFGDITQDDLMETFKVNTVGPVLLTQALINQVERGKRKLIVNTSSQLGSIELNQDVSWFWFSYRLSKSALNAATRTLANQLKSKGIIVISMDPGWVKTDMGGKNAPTTTEECVKGIMSALEGVSLSDTGMFVGRDGLYVPW